jgi:hypothetical protein
MCKYLYCADFASYHIKYLLSQIFQKAASVNTGVFAVGHLHTYSTNSFLVVASSSLYRRYLLILKRPSKPYKPGIFTF